MYSCYFLLKFVELELVILTLKQGEIYLTFAGSNFDLVYLNGGSFVGVFTHAGLDLLVIALYDLKVIGVAHYYNKLLETDKIDNTLVGYIKCSINQSFAVILSNTFGKATTSAYLTSLIP